MAAPIPARTLALEALALEPETLSTAPPRCENCGETVGVYEPLVHVLYGLPRETSRAAEPHLSHNLEGSYYHVACFSRLSAPQ
jgi:hypothetical protein